MYDHTPEFRPDAVINGSCRAGVLRCLGRNRLDFSETVPEVLSRRRRDTGGWQTTICRRRRRRVRAFVSLTGRPSRAAHLPLPARVVTASECRRWDRVVGVWVTCLAWPAGACLRSEDLGGDLSRMWGSMVAKSVGLVRMKTAAPDASPSGGLSQRETCWDL